MSEMGQNAKYSSRVNVFRFAPDNRHAVTAPHDRFVPMGDIAGLPDMKEAANRGGFTFCGGPASDAGCVLWSA